jgi:hypothetical protein
MSAPAADIVPPFPIIAARSPLGNSGSLRVAENFSPRYAHIVFTLPRHLAPLVLQNNKLIYDLLFRASAETLLEVARNPKYLGAEIGFFKCTAHLEPTTPTSSHVHCALRHETAISSSKTPRAPARPASLRLAVEQVPFPNFSNFALSHTFLRQLPFYLLFSSAQLLPQPPHTFTYVTPHDNPIPITAPRPPQPPAAPFKRLYRTRPEISAALHDSARPASDKALTFTRSWSTKPAFLARGRRLPRRFFESL